MALLSCSLGTIDGMCVCVPETVRENRACGEWFSEETINNTIKNTGVERRRIADAQTCTSDLCFHAAESLLSRMDVPREHIDLLLFVSQSADYISPATACLLQHRLGLRKETAAFDIHMACSGYIYALATAYGYLQGDGIETVLVLAGDTATKVVSPYDRTLALLAGDAGSATLLRKKASAPAAKTCFSLNTDGAGAEHLIVEAGGYRNPASEQTLAMKEQAEGGSRSDHHLKMNGMDVFNFTAREVAGDIRKLTEFAQADLNSFDCFAFHQSSRFIIQFIARSLKVSMDNVPLPLVDYGNTICASVPMAVVSHCLAHPGDRERRVLMSGYGGGLSWGTCQTTLPSDFRYDLIEV
ncbi:ketoacyl-ACP synthase III [Desulfatiferula olefinivorans]